MSSYISWPSPICSQHVVLRIKCSAVAWRVSSAIGSILGFTGELCLAQCKELRLRLLLYVVVSSHCCHLPTQGYLPMLCWVLSLCWRMGPSDQSAISPIYWSDGTDGRHNLCFCACTCYHIRVGNLLWVMEERLLQWLWINANWLNIIALLFIDEPVMLLNECWHLSLITTNGLFIVVETRDANAALPAAAASHS